MGTTSVREPLWLFYTDLVKVISPKTTQTYDSFKDLLLQRTPELADYFMSTLVGLLRYPGFLEPVEREFLIHWLGEDLKKKHMKDSWLNEIVEVDLSTFLRG